MRATSRERDTLSVIDAISQLKEGPDKVKKLRQTFTKLREKTPEVPVRRKKPQTEINIELLPRSLHINSRKDERTVTAIKQKFRENMLHRGCHGYMYSTRGRMSKAYYHDLARMPEFGEDEHGIERV